MPDLCANEAQMTAIKHRFGAMLVLAGPGSGKTFVISQRIKYLIEEYHTNPNHIYVITFTKAAALEMQSRFDAVVSCRYPVHFGTFHSIFFSILRQTYSYQIDNIITEKEKRDYLSKILKSYIPAEDIQQDTISDILVQISRIKNAQPLDCENFYTLNPEIFYLVQKDYQKLMKTNRKLDFDDMVLLCEEMFETRPDILAVWQKKVSFLLIDEVQDINARQYRVVKMLSEPENNLFIVGDDDQSIYGFRGARPDFILNFQQDYPAAVKVLLPYNYRCAPQIVEASLAVIEENKLRLTKDIMSAKTDSGKVAVTAFESREKETEYLVATLKKLSLEELEETALIYRTHSQMKRIARELAKAQVPFKMKEKIQNPFLEESVMDILAYLSLSQEYQKAGAAKLERKSFLRVMNRPDRSLDRQALLTEWVSIEELLQYYRDSPRILERLYKMKMDFIRLAAMEPYAAVNYIRRGIGYNIYLKTKNGNERMMEQAEWFQQFVKEYKSVDKLLSDMPGLTSHVDKGMCKEGHGAALLTMHASKGLEYDRVFLPELNEGIIPHKKSVTQEQIEEERRMLYVGMTRAREELLISYITGEKNKKPEAVSRFLYPILSL